MFIDETTVADRSFWRSGYDLHARRSTGDKTREQVMGPHGSRAGGGRGNGRLARARAKLSVEGDPPSLAVSAGRQRGRRRPAAGGEALRKPGPADGRRQPLRGVGGDRHGDRDELAAGRL